MPTVPADLPAMNVALKTWVDAQIAASGDLVAYAAAPYTVVWGSQSGPRPALPYAALSWAIPIAGLGGKPSVEMIDNLDDTFTRRQEYDGEGVFRIELLSRADLDPDSGTDEVMPLLAGLEASLYNPLQTELFTAAGLAFGETRGPPLAIPQVAGFGNERRGRLDVAFRARVRVDVINYPVLVSASLNDIEGTVDGNEVEITIGTSP